MRGGASPARGLVLLGVAAVAAGLGYLGLSQYLSHHPGQGSGWPDILYYDLQLFVLSAAPASGPGPIPLALQLARFLAPATTVLAGVETLRVLLGEQLRRWSAAHASGHAVVTGDGLAAVELARQLRAEFRTVVLAGADPETAALAGQYGLLTVPGDATDAATLRAAGAGRARVLYACARDSTTNAATALQARQMSRGRGRSLVAYAQVRDAEICTALRARRVGAAGDPQFQLGFFALEEVAARVLLDRHPVTGPDGQAGQVVIIGFGGLGRAVLSELARRRQPGSVPLAVTVVTDGNAGEVAGFLSRFPAVAGRFRVTTAAHLPPAAGGSLVFVCLPGNDDALRAGLAAAHRPGGHSDRVVICMSEPSPFGAVLTGDRALLDDVEGRLAIFGVIEEACLPERIRADLTDQLARAIHHAYLEERAAAGDSPEVNTSLRPWEELPPDLRQANLAQAMGIGVKLDAIGCALVPESPAVPAFSFAEGEIDRLARLEHDRWVRERLARGYVHGPVRDDRHYPDLIDWDGLTAEAQEKDLAAVRRLPGILCQAGFQILRLPGRDPAGA